MKGALAAIERPGREKTLPSGKLPTSLLACLLRKYARSAKGVVVGPSIGMDSAVVIVDGKLLALKSDPITFVSENSGEYAVHVNANDIAVMGGAPRWFLATVLLPRGKATPSSAERIFKQISSACEEVGAALIGGHTEVTPGIDRPIVAGHMIGDFKDRRVITSAGARPGDALILTKGVAIEATAIMARELSGEIAKAFSPAFVKRCARYFKDPGISVVKDAEAAMKSGRVNAMHDPTEGGLSAALHELSIASKCSIVVEKDLIPVLPESKALCEFFDINPLGAISSGALLISAPFAHSRTITDALTAASIRSAIIGRVSARGRGVKIIIDGKKRALRHIERDELTRILV